jgi:hypothetical protein
MNHWFSDTIVEVMETDSTAKAVVEAGNRRRLLYQTARDEWIKHRQSQGKNLNFKLTEYRTVGEDVLDAYKLNIANETLNQFLLIGLDPFNANSSTNPIELAGKQLHRIPAFTSTVLDISYPVLSPFIPYNPDNSTYKERQGKDTIQTLYSAWEQNPAPQNAERFLALAQTSEVIYNLEKLNSFPGEGTDGRARNPGHCHVDMRFMDEKTFPTSPRELLIRLGQSALAETEHLTMATLLSGVGFNAATHTFYTYWPKRSESGSVMST